jgi:hypothetical protein
MRATLRASAGILGSAGHGRENPRDPNGLIPVNTVVLQLCEVFDLELFKFAAPTIFNPSGAASAVTSFS